MDRRRTKPLIPPLSGRWARAGLGVLLAAVVAVGAQARTTDGTADRGGQPAGGIRATERSAGASGTTVPRGRNSDLRTGTWSIYAGGGLSWAAGVWYQNLDAKRSYKQSPAVGGGVDFTIRPWVRVGAEYLWSRYRREQRFSVLDTRTMPVKVYGNYLMNFHDARLGAQFNLLELWPRRRAQWLNIWAGTGAGCTFARGNEYGIWFSSTITQDGKTTPLTDGTTIGNESSVTVTGSVRAQNRHEGFNAPYIPVSLHIEADLDRRFTVGIKGETDWLLNRKDAAPRNYAFVLLTLRWNFTGPGGRN